jgi:hypothetical protein
MRRFTEEQAREAVARSRSYSGVLRALGIRPAGGNHRMIRRYVDEVWKIPTDHFSPGATAARRRPLDEILVAGSTYSREHLKRRLFDAGLKSRRCEQCGQGEEWRGRRMALILDHINGVWDDHRLENLRILCPNCNATLDTHCGRKNRVPPQVRPCAGCAAPFVPRDRRVRYCSRSCARRHAPRPSGRRVERPPVAELRRQVERDGYRATGRRYGVSDTAVRQWLRVASTP